MSLNMATKHSISRQVEGDQVLGGEVDVHLCTKPLYGREIQFLLYSEIDHLCFTILSLKVAMSSAATCPFHRLISIYQQIHLHDLLRRITFYTVFSPQNPGQYKNHSYLLLLVNLEVYRMPKYYSLWGVNRYFHYMM